MRKKNREKERDYGILVSKKFWYSLIACFIGLVIVIDFCLVLNGVEMALRLLPTLAGLAFTFFILIIFFDVREQLEWREVEKKVKKQNWKTIEIVF